MDKKRRRKKKSIGAQVMAFVLCCVFLCGQMPLAVSAAETEMETLSQSIEETDVQTQPETVSVPDTEPSLQSIAETDAPTQPETVSVPETEPSTQITEETDVQTQPETVNIPETEPVPELTEIMTDTEPETTMQAIPATEKASEEQTDETSALDTEMVNTEVETTGTEAETQPGTTEGETSAGAAGTESETQEEQTEESSETESGMTEEESELQTSDETDEEDSSEKITEAQSETEIKKPEFSYQTTLDSVTVSIHAEEGILPEGTTVTVKPLDEAVLENAAQSINDRLGEKEVVQIIGFDICFFDPDGNELHDLDEKVKIVYSGMNIAEEAEEAQVYHADEEGNITHTLTEAAAPSETVEFTSDQFSPVLYAAYNDGISALAIAGPTTVAVGETIQLEGSSGNCSSHQSWKSNNKQVATVDKTTGVVSGVSASAEPVTITHTYCNNRGWYHDTRTETYQVTVTEADPSGKNDGAQVYYLKSPTSDPDSNAVNQWGSEVTYYGNRATVNTTGATWTDNKNIFKQNANINNYIISWPDGSTGANWTLDKTIYSGVYQAVYDTYKEELAKQVGITDLQLEDIEEITLVPYKISKDNGTTPDKHIDCTISVKCSKAYVARFNVQKPGKVGYTNVSAVNKKIINNKPESIDEYKDESKVPETIVGSDGITYSFDGWYNEAGEKVEVESWPYTPNDGELANGTVDFYARYVPATRDITIEKNVTGSMGDVNKYFSFTCSYGDKTDTFTLKNKGTYILKDVSIGTELTLTETNANGYTTSAVYGETTVTASQRVMIFTINGTDDRIVVTNNKEGSPDTGVLLDSLPYVLILAIVVIGGVVFFRKRRSRYDD